MRIVAGDLKGRVIKAVPGNETRPTSDKVKEAIFHKLGPYFNEGTCLDLFAGSGSLGIEAISRGMDQTTFIEKSGKAIKIIHHNVDQLQIRKKSEIYRNDALKAVNMLGKKQRTFDLILVDPPYEKVSYEKVLETIEQNNILTSDGKVYVECGSLDLITFNPAYFSVSYEKTYSPTTSVMILVKNNHSSI